jgi:hypothetical protein
MELIFFFYILGNPSTRNGRGVHAMKLRRMIEYHANRMICKSSGAKYSHKVSKMTSSSSSSSSSTLTRFNSSLLQRKFSFTHLSVNSYTFRWFESCFDTHYHLNSPLKVWVGINPEIMMAIHVLKRCGHQRTLPTLPLLSSSYAMLHHLAVTSSPVHFLPVMR